MKKYIPELANYPVEYIYEPWQAPLEVQEKAGCVIGKDYPERIVIHEEACAHNTKQMHAIKNKLMHQLHEVASVSHVQRALNIYAKDGLLSLFTGTEARHAIGRGRDPGVHEVYRDVREPHDQASSLNTKADFSTKLTRSTTYIPTCYLHATCCTKRVELHYA